MHTVSVKLGARASAVAKAFSAPILAVALLLPNQTLADLSSTDARFRQYIFDICNTAVAPAGWDVAALGNMCPQAFPGGPAGGQFTAVVSANLGAGNAGSDLAGRKKKGIRELLDEQQEKPAKGASADGGGWGFMVAPQVGRSSRPQTDLENGFRADLTGLAAGLDYRFSDRFVLGMAVAETRDKATFVSDSGFLKSRSDTAMLYATWLASERITVDGYAGSGKLHLEKQNRYAFGPLIAGTMTGKTTGRQTMAGLSASYQMDIGRINLMPSFNIDSIRTRINGYSETGSDAFTNLMALRYSDRTVSSLTGTLGARLSTSHGYDWGILTPSARVAAVREFANKTREITNELVITPGTGFSVATDAPDRNYMIVELGMTAALNRGAQVFLDYEKRVNDRLLSSWAVSTGVLLGF